MSAPFVITISQQRTGDAIGLSIHASATGARSQHEYSWRMRITVEHGGVVRLFFSGDDSVQNHEPLDDEPPWAHLPWLRDLGEPIGLTVELRIRDGKRSRTFAGRAAVAGEARAELALASAGKLTGVPFDGGAPPPEDRAHRLTDHRLREVPVPGAGLLCYEETGGDFDPRGTRVVLHDHAGAAHELFVPGNTVTPPGERYPKNWRHFDGFHAAPTGWVVLLRLQREPFAHAFTAFRPAQLDRRIDVLEPFLYTDFDLTGRVFWFTVGGQLRLLDLETGELVGRDYPELVRLSVERSALVVTDRLVCGFTGGRLEIADWRTGELLERREVPSFDERPLFHPAPRRMVWLRRLGLAEGPLSVVRWQDLDTLACGDVVVHDYLLEGTLLADGRVVATGDGATWLVSPDRATAEHLGRPVRGRPMVTCEAGRWRWHDYRRDDCEIVELGPL